MNNIFFVSDTHCGHNQPFLYEPRGFSSVEEMDETIIENWNKIVKPDDMVIHLGDVILNDNEHGLECLRRLNGQISLVWGNHETDTRKKFLGALPNVITLGYAHQFKYGKLTFYLSHYPALTANYDDKHFSQHVFNLHGHTHQRANWLDPKNPFMYHVGLDSHNNTPVHIDEIITDIRQRWNEIGRLPTPVQPQDTYPYGGLIHDNDFNTDGK